MRMVGSSLEIIARCGGLAAWDVCRSAVFRCKHVAECFAPMWSTTCGRKSCGVSPQHTSAKTWLAKDSPLLPLRFQQYGRASTAAVNLAMMPPTMEARKQHRQLHQ